MIANRNKPMLLALWEDFLDTEAPKLSADIEKMPIIVGMRLSVNTFHGKFWLCLLFMGSILLVFPINVCEF